MLDSARHYQSPDFIKRLIDAMALHKLNVLHWHLTDDQGWRLEIRKYPRLTEVGAWRIPAGAAWPRTPDPATGQRAVYGGFYTQEKVRDIVAYAAARFVTIVPEIEMPGHAQAAIAAIPQLGTGGRAAAACRRTGACTTTSSTSTSRRSRSSRTCCTKSSSSFPAPYIHVGGDEAVKDRWKSSPRVQARMRELGLADEAALQGWFVARIGRFLESRGRRLIGWDEILEGGIPAGASSCPGAGRTARSPPRARDTTSSWRPRRSSTSTTCRAMRRTSRRAARRSSRSKTSTRYEPVPAGARGGGGLARARRAGSMPGPSTCACRNASSTRLSRASPRSPKSTWSPAAHARLAGLRLRAWRAQFARYRTLGIHYADSAFEPRWSLTPGTDASSLRVGLSKQVSFGAIRYTRDGSDPSPASAAYEAPFEARVGTTLKAAAFDGEQPPQRDRHGTSRSGRLASPHERGAQPSARAISCCASRTMRRSRASAPFFNVDIVDPCWIWPDVDLARGATLRASVGQLPFNFQIGKDADAIRRGDARTASGELEVRTGDCSGEPVAVIPLAGGRREPGAHDARPGPDSAAARGRPDVPPVRAARDRPGLGNPVGRTRGSGPWLTSS